MTNIHLTDDDLVLHYYGEMDDAAERRACAHLEGCALCRENLARLQRVMAAIDSTPVPEPDEFFERRTWARIGPELADLRPSAAPARYLPWRAMAWGAAAAMIVIAAFVAGRFTTTPPAPAPGQTQQASTAAPVGERVLLVDLGDHLDRSELALVEFVSGSDRGSTAAGRSRAEELVAANRLYRHTAEASGDAAVTDVLDELERTLIEIASTSPTSGGDLDVVRRRIDTRGLLFKLRVMREQLQERVRDTRQPKGQDTTL